MGVNFYPLSSKHVFIHVHEWDKALMMVTAIHMIMLLFVYHTWFFSLHVLIMFTVQVDFRALRRSI